MFNITHFMLFYANLLQMLQTCYKRIIAKTFFIVKFNHSDIGISTKILHKYKVLWTFISYSHGNFFCLFLSYIVTFLLFLIVIELYFVYFFQNHESKKDIPLKLHELLLHPPASYSFFHIFPVSEGLLYVLLLLQRQVVSLTVLPP